MNFEKTRIFLANIKEYTEQEIISNMQNIKRYFEYGPWDLVKEHIDEIIKVVGKNKAIYELFNTKNKFSWWDEKLDIPEKLKFGIEIEVECVPLSKIEYVFNSGAISSIMENLQVPTNISNAIIQNVDFKKKDQFNKWIFSPEAGMDASEASSPIMTNNLYDLNQVVAICALFRALNAKLNEGTGLHINIGVDYLECNEKAIENILKIWGECEELFFKMANPEDEEIRANAQDMAIPIKENIQKFLETDGSVNLKSEEDMEMFLYQIQVMHRLRKIVAWTNLEHDLNYAKTDEERFNVYHRYNRGIKETNEDDKVRWTSINFNHMEWNNDEAGRIEVRIFNSSLDPEIIFQDIVLVGKIFEVSKKNAKDSNYKSQEFGELFKHNVTEDTKVDKLLNLLFEKQEQKEIFKKRWESVKEKKQYRKYKSGTDTFER